MADLSKPEHFDIVLEFAFGFADRGIPLSLVLVEPVDLSDSPRGVLTQLEDDIRRRTRRSDRVTRITDRRFAILLVDCNRQGALVFADRLQQTLSDFVETSGCPVSCGVATFGRDIRTPSDFMNAAGDALQRAHAAGGGTIELHDSPGTSA
jgi:PleD family two-component response regulator